MRHGSLFSGIGGFEAPGRSLFLKRDPNGHWNNWPAQPLFYRRNDGLPTGMDGITLSKWKEESVSAFGNAIVPEVAWRVFSAVNEFQTKSKLIN